MLADLIIADSELRSGLGQGHRRLADDLAAAQRFELAEGFAAAADQIASAPASLPKALPMCRLPADACWFETAFSARDAFVTGRDFGPMFRKDMHRIGILLRVGDGDPLVWEASLGWSFRSGECSVSNWAMRLDLREEPDRVARVRPADLMDTRLTGEGRPRSPADAAALAEIENRATFAPSSYHRELLAHLPDDPRIRAVAEAMGQGDWNGEPLFWMAAIALLNGRNVSETVPGPDLSKLSRARAKRGQAALLDYSVCRLSPRIAAARGGAAGGDGRSARAHFVRGHFKVRPGGIFWWSPHVRGDASAGSVAKGYVVT